MRLVPKGKLPPRLVATVSPLAEPIAQLLYDLGDDLVRATEQPYEQGRRTAERVVDMLDDLVRKCRRPIPPSL